MSNSLQGKPSLLLLLLLFFFLLWGLLTDHLVRASGQHPTEEPSDRTAHMTLGEVAGTGHP